MNRKNNIREGIDVTIMRNHNSFEMGRNIFLRLTCIFFVSMVSIGSYHVKAELVQALICNLTDGSTQAIPVCEEAVLVPQGSELLVKSCMGEITLALDNISSFTTGETDFELPDPDPENPEEPEIPDAGVDAVQSIGSSLWTIYSLDGRQIASGYGKPDFSNLEKGRIFVVKQGSLRYKIKP